VGTLSVAGPVVRLRKERYEELFAALARAAREVSAIWPLHRRQRPIAGEDSLEPAKVRSRRSPSDGLARGAAR
jgi:hypothetical protein